MRRDNENDPADEALEDLSEEVEETTDDEAPGDETDAPGDGPADGEGDGQAETDEEEIDPEQLVGGVTPRDDFHVALQRDYTRKTQRLAEERKSLQTAA